MTSLRFLRSSCLLHSRRGSAIGSAEDGGSWKHALGKPKLREAFSAAGISFDAQEQYIGMYSDPESDEPDLVQDRFTFAGVADDDTRGVERERAAALVQRIIDTVPESRPRPGGC